MSTDDLVRQQATNGNAEIHEISEITYKVREGYVLLTFDDGPSAYTKAFVDILADRGIQAMFFFIGTNSLVFPESVQYASDQGMLIGNHSWNHENLKNASQKSQKKNLQRTNELLESLTGDPIAYFRPPYGLWNESLQEVIGELGMKNIMWNRDSKDWRAGSKDEILEFFYSSDLSGGIYLFHENEHTLAALPYILDYLEKNNVKFVNLQ